MFQCPRCDTPLGDQTPAGELEAVCVSCHYAYHVITGTLSDHASLRRPLVGSTDDRPRSYETEHELRVRLPGNREKRVSFTIPSSADRILPRSGDLVSVIATMKEKHAQDIVLIVNHTTGSAVHVDTPGAMARRRAWLLGGAVGLVVGVMTAVVAPFMGAVAMGLVAGAATFVVTFRRAAPTRSLTDADVEQLTESRDLMEEKVSLRSARDEIAREIGDRSALGDRLLALRREMERVGGGVYGARIGSIDGALSLLDKQSAIDRELITAYDNMIAIIGIEIESRAMAGALPDDVSGHLEQRRAELADLLARHSDLTLQIEANDEVERLLKG